MYNNHSQMAGERPGTAAIVVGRTLATARFERPHCHHLGKVGSVPQWGSNIISILIPQKYDLYIGIMWN